MSAPTRQKRLAFPSKESAYSDVRHAAPDAQRCRAARRPLHRRSPESEGGGSPEVRTEVGRRGTGQGGQGQVGRARVAARRRERTGLRSEVDPRWVESDQGRRDGSRRCGRQDLADGFRRPPEEHRGQGNGGEERRAANGDRCAAGRLKSRPSLAFYDARAARRSTSWPLQRAGFPIPPGPR